MTTEEIKKIVDDERAEQLTALLCRHWEVATQRVDTLALEANQRVIPLIDRVRTEGHPRVFRELSVRIYFSCIYASKLPLFLSIAIMKFPLHFLFL